MNIAVADEPRISSVQVTDDLITGWIKWKREMEIAPMRLRPVPYEFDLYYDA